MNPEQYVTPFSVLHAVSLLSHRSRIHKFQTALELIVTTDSYVVDLGTGTGILAMLAAKAGARRVTAIEIDKGTADYATSTIRENGLEDQVEVINAHFRDFTPDEPADVVICEMLSSILLVEQQIPAALHATQHILKEDGILIPSKVAVSCAPVQSETLWNRFSCGGLSFQKCPQTVSLEEVREIADFQPVHNFDLQNVSRSLIVEEVMEYEVVTDGTVHGLVGLFEAIIFEDVLLTMRDGWRDLFMPLERPERVSQGDTISVAIRFIPGEYDSLSIDLSVNKAKHT